MNISLCVCYGLLICAASIRFNSIDVELSALVGKLGIFTSRLISGLPTQRNTYDICNLTIAAPKKITKITCCTFQVPKETFAELFIHSLHRSTWTHVLNQSHSTAAEHIALNDVYTDSKQHTPLTLQVHPMPIHFAALRTNLNSKLQQSFLGEHNLIKLGL